MKGPMKYGEAIELIKTKWNLAMYREAWHGIELDKIMYIRHLGKAHQPSITFNTDKGHVENKMIDFIFLFISEDKTYSWNPSQNDIESNDWMILEI